MAYQRIAHEDPSNDNSATDATVVINALATGLEALEAPAWDDLRLSLTKASTGAASPSLTVFRSPVQCYAFSKTVAQELFFDVQLPHNWVEGSDVEPHVHWSPGNSTDTGSVRWQLTYTWANYGAAFAAPTTMTAVDQAASGTAYDHQLCDLGTIVGTDKTMSSVIMCRLARLASADEDTFDAVAFGLSVDFHIQVQGNGSATEMPE